MLPEVATRLARFRPRRLGSGAVAALVLLASLGACRAGPPFLADIAYDVHPLDKLDIYRPAGSADAPFVVFIHGGGWWNGDKRYLPAGDVAFFTDRGIAVVAINTRNIPAAQDDHLFPPLLGPLRDAQRALQFLRYHAKAFALQADKAALWGDSAGAFDALWLGVGPERAEAASLDPVARQSTRVAAIAAANAQTSIDPAQMRAWVGPRLNYGGHAFGLAEADFAGFLARRDEFARFYPALSPAALVSKASPPMFLLYTYPRDEGSVDPMYYVHSPDFGANFARLARGRGAPVTYRNSGDPAARVEMMRFIAAALGAK